VVREGLELAREALLAQGVLQQRGGDQVVPLAQHALAQPAVGVLALLVVQLLALTEHGAEVEGGVLDRGGELHLGREVLDLVLPRLQLLVLLLG
jgi:hypothetical protein